MKKGLFFRVFLLIGFLGVCLYSYLDLQNEITKLRISIPHLASEVRRIEEENTHFRYEIIRFESPENLMHIAASSEFSHLKFPSHSSTLTMRQGAALGEIEAKVSPMIRVNPSIQFAAGAKP